MYGPPTTPSSNMQVPGTPVLNVSVSVCNCDLGCDWMQDLDQAKHQGAWKCWPKDRLVHNGFGGNLSLVEVACRIKLHLANSIPISKVETSNEYFRSKKEEKLSKSLPFSYQKERLNLYPSTTCPRGVITFWSWRVFKFNLRGIGYIIIEVTIRIYRHEVIHNINIIFRMKEII